MRYLRVLLFASCLAMVAGGPLVGAEPGVEPTVDPQGTVETPADEVNPDTADLLLPPDAISMCYFDPYCADQCGQERYRCSQICDSNYPINSPEWEECENACNLANIECGQTCVVCP